MVAFPALTGVTTPFALTLAIFLLLVFHPLPLDENDCWYWTSTEVTGQETAKAWLYSTGSGAMQETPKTQAHKVRPIITLNR